MNIRELIFQPGVICVLKGAGLKQALIKSRHIILKESIADFTLAIEVRERELAR